MKKDNFFASLIKKIEFYLPMSFGSFLLFCFTLYLFFLVGRSIINNYDSNKSLDQQVVDIQNLKQKVSGLQDQINYYQTDSYKEKEAREKLGYVAPGESVVALPFDTDQNSAPEKEYDEATIKTPNYMQWWNYFF